ncbi:MFS transporter [Thermotoga sp. KOL6]|uniref:MFS transporter n=1 Tax=Thermotoga sp. KOL6 TaxID=126741 RepID=UPI000C78BFC2|nr:MFS transporter [Thermotoga sp. KOL6]PLV59784.1 MFS transporter [Thermotoga sp. KOL6]
MKLRLMIIEFLVYGSMAVYSLLSQFLANEGLTKSQIGILMAIMPLSSLYANHLNFDIASSIGRTNWLKKVVLASGILFWGLFLFERFPMKFIFMVTFAFFFSAVAPLAESVIVDITHQSKMNYGRIRLFGTFGFSFSALLMSVLIRIGFVTIFVVFSFLMILTFSILKGMNEVELGEEEKSRSKKPLPMFFWLLLPVVIFGIAANNFNFVFLPVLMEERSYDVSLASVAFSLMAITETPFLLWADMIVQKLGVPFMLASGVFVIGLRNLLVTMVHSPSTLLLIQLLQGWTYIVIYYSMMFLIRSFGPARIRAQKYFWISMGIGPFLGSSFGGLIAEKLGLMSTYTVFGLVPMIVSFLIFLFFRKVWKI